MLETQKNYCPYCGEIIELVFDLSVPEQDYIEDCYVCCRPIVVRTLGYGEDDKLVVQVSADNQ